MIRQGGFRGLSRAQKEIIGHWEAVRGDRSLPGKSDIDPGALRTHLASISIIELSAHGEARFRIAGSGLRRMLGGEMRGRFLNELESDLAAMWSLGLNGAIRRAEPVGGIVERSKDQHAWLRLPLEAENGARNLVMCHDVLLSNRKPERPEHEDFLSALTRGLAA
ncbi:PAS domain-containing protein [Henriciella sp.]|uniref:PAS domain-containing protein n=1 Tax=Henriciella sp. TaxID=1968823 RepID=UPI00262112B3|nr:PAS domain-containing protein [Henriciella sp.]